MEAAARTPPEPVVEGLRAIWKDVLGVEQVGEDDDFFDLGGDSWLALVVATRAAKAGYEMPASAVLRKTTVRTLAEAVASPELFEDGLSR